MLEKKNYLIREESFLTREKLVAALGVTIG